MTNCKTCKYDDSANKRCETCGEGYMYYEPSPNYSSTPIDWDEPIVVKIKKSSFKDSDRATAFFLKVKEMKIKIEEPKSKSNGLYETFIIHLDTIQKKIVFTERFINILKQQNNDNR